MVPQPPFPFTPPADPLAPASAARPRRKPWRLLYFWVLVGVGLGVAYGVCFPANPIAGQFSLARWAGAHLPAGVAHAVAGMPSGAALKPLGEGFVNLIKMLIAPIVFCTVAGGIASAGDLGKAGRIGLKALIYFEVVTTLAMLTALVIVHALQPGRGVDYQPSAAEVSKAAGFQEDAEKQTALGFIMHLVPKTVMGAFAEGDILQVLLVSVLIGAAMAKLGPAAEPVVRLVHLVGKVFFQVVGFIVCLAPLAAFGAMAATVGEAGVKALLALLKMMACFYLACGLFVFVALAAIAHFNGFSLFKYLRHIKDELLLVLGTSSSESALPPMMAKLERLGCGEEVVGLVLPAGYSFNLDGTSIYLAMAVVFLSQVTNTPLGLEQELGLLGLLLLTSKGAAAITGGGFITLTATLSSAHHTALLAGLAFLVGIDRFMSEARAITNLIGNGLATLIIAKSEGALDLDRAAPVLRATAKRQLPEPARES